MVNQISIENCIFCAGIFTLVLGARREFSKSPNGRWRSRKTPIQKRDFSTLFSDSYHIFKVSSIVTILITLLLHGGKICRPVLRPCRRFGRPLPTLAHLMVLGEREKPLPKAISNMNGSLKIFLPYGLKSSTPSVFTT